MTDKASQSAKQLLTISPQFQVQDVVETTKYYRDKLGFTIDFIYGDPPFHASVSRDGVSIIFHKSSTVDIRITAEHEKEIKAYVCVKDIDALYEELKSRGAEVVYGPQSQSYGMREFNIKDCNGYISALVRKYRF
ncbi:VOC family protein [candidate division KSB1 bacterium]|nr:VOC family protein [candidate division KSB1 bacterium]